MVDKPGSKKRRRAKPVAGQTSPLQGFLRDLVSSGIEHFGKNLPLEVSPYLADLRSGIDKLIEQALNSSETKLDPYMLLGVSPQDDWPTIRSRYRELVRLLHTDRGGDSKLFEMVNDAYRELERRHKS